MPLKPFLPLALPVALEMGNVKFAEKGRRRSVQSSIHYYSSSALLKVEHGIGMTTHWGHVFHWYFIWSRAQFCIFIRAPYFRKSTHPRKFDNQVTLHRPPRNQVNEEPFCECATSKSLFTSFLFIFYLKCDRHRSKLLKINHQPSKLPSHWDSSVREDPGGNQVTSW